MTTLTVSDLVDVVEDQALAMDIGWVIFCGSMVFITQLGFFQLECAFTNEIWIHSIILKNFEDAFAGILLFSMLGMGIQQSTSSVIGYNTDYFLLHNVPESEYVHIFYQSLYAIASTTIVSSCVLERIKNKPYLLVIVFMSMVQFPLLSHWCWSEHGWLRALGYVDFSGGSVVHISGGVTGLVLIIYLGNRQMVSDYMRANKQRAQSNRELTSSAMGIFLLWFGWFGFNCGSAMSISAAPFMIGRIALNTSLCSASGGAVAALLVRDHLAELSTIVNGVLIGLVAATGGAHVLEPWAAVLTGSASGLVIIFWKKAIARFGLDDPLSATAVHIGGGCVSIVCTGLFRIDHGLVYGGAGCFSFLGIQLLGCLLIVTLSLLSSFLFCFVLETTVGLRVDIFAGYLDKADNRANVSETLNIAVTVRTPTTNAWLWHFHRFLEKRLSFEHLDFLVAANRLITKIDYFKRNYAMAGGSGALEADKEELLLRDRDSLIDLYLSSASDYVVNVSAKQLKFFSAERDHLQPQELRTVLLEVYVEVLRMLQIPFTEFVREYHRRQRKTSDVSSQGSSDDNNHRYRKVYHVQGDYRISWRITRYSPAEHCWCCVSALKLCAAPSNSVMNDELTRPARISSQRPSIVFPEMVPDKFRQKSRCPRESFMISPTQL